MNKEVRLHLANAKEYKQGNRLSKWFDLPLAKEKIFGELEIQEGDFQEECLLLAYEAPFKVTRSYSLNELNNFAENLKNLPSWISSNLDELVGGRGDEVLLDVLLSGGRCFQKIEGVSNYRNLGKYLVKKHFDSVTHSGFTPFLDRHFDYAAFAKECNEWSFEGENYYFIDGMCIQFNQSRLM
ncbi:antirestriction protein ArdA [Enterococcus gallinarum]|uniref:antirestriction protein ArdA n=1 Tax=Enterococcus gallinarum TaxID=1353 RepID=UPI0018AAFE79|nr:antirestriction protein ArdA [Enterococcus gallinarum]